VRRFWQVFRGPEIFQRRDSFRGGFKMNGKSETRASPAIRAATQIETRPFSLSGSAASVLPETSLPFDIAMPLEAVARLIGNFRKCSHQPGLFQEDQK
jgi:hypothetical protein